MTSTSSLIENIIQEKLDDVLHVLIREKLEFNFTKTNSVYSIYFTGKAVNNIENIVIDLQNLNIVELNKLDNLYKYFEEF